MKDTIIKNLSLLGKELEQGNKTPFLQEAIKKSCAANTWFSIKDIDYQLKGISLWLKENTLREFCSNYSFAKKAKTIAVICAGNIPAVAFHDLLCVILSGNAFLAKLSGDDQYLLPAIFNRLCQLYPTLSERINFTKERINSQSTDLKSLFGGVIATGSTNSSLYFEYYFKDLPHIIRHARSSVAVLDGKEKDYSPLMQDILTHKQRGCRNVCKVFVPTGFCFDKITIASKEYSFLLDENRYRNNYDYHKAMFIMNAVKHIDTSVLLFLESTNLFAPVAVVNFEYYTCLQTVQNYLQENADNIQCIASNIPQITKAIPLGSAQKPQITDFEDGVDTMSWLCNLQ